MTALPDPEPMFFHVVTARRVLPGDVLYEINDRPLRGGPMTIARVRHTPAESGTRTREGWELVPTCSRFSRFVHADTRLKVGRYGSARRINPIVAAAAKPRRTPKRPKRVDADQLSLFETPWGKS
ncbi:hypothetical protein [Nocardia brasiliensis]|uniref:hypothetical protein n=1 Tax=Nocardia brasiliensis TaxID=37326 RepID=UPI0004A74DC9|nr:hypothetical protein [Nocardia brasiliensis]